jgi:hypothetical protein
MVNSWQVFAVLVANSKHKKNRPCRAAFVGSSGFIGWLCDEN